MPKEFQNLSEFGGINNNDLPEKISDRNCSYANAIDFSVPGMIKAIGSSSGGVGQLTTGISGSTSGDIFVFKKAFGTIKEILVRTYYNSGATYLQWWNDGELNNYAGQWELISIDGYDASAQWGFANANGDGGEAINKLIMGNGVNWMMYWNGATTRLASVTSNTIVCDDVLATEGFTINAYGVADHVLINGAQYTYTGISNKTFTGVSPDPTSDFSSGTIKVGDGVTMPTNDRLMRESLYTSNTIEFATTGATTGNYLNDSNALFVTNNEFQLGQRITVTGATNTQNNNTFTIKDITETRITFDDGELATTEAVGAVVTISAGTPKGNILLTTQGKLFMNGVVGRESTTFYSKTDDTTDFSISSGLASSGSFTLTDGGGAVTALIEGNANTVIVHKTNNVTAYTRTLNSSNLVVEDFNNLLYGNGVGAINNNSITKYGKQHYFLNGNGEIKVMTQSLYSSTLFDFSDIGGDIKDFLSDATRVSNKQYMIYNPYKKCLVISTLSIDMSGGLYNNLVYIFIKQGAQGYIYDTSIEKISTSLPAQEMPMVFFNYGSYTNSIIIHFPYNRNTYPWLKFTNTQSSLSGRATYMTKEYTFNEPAQDKEFSIMMIDGFLYSTTKIKISVLYGEFGEKGTKVYFLDYTSSCVDPTLIKNKNYSILGEYSMPFLYKNYLIRESRYFKLPIHIDIKKSDRYRIKIETSGTVAGTWWAINNISTNVELKGVNMNELINQNKESIDGVGTMIVGSTNIVGKI